MVGERIPVILAVMMCVAVTSAPCADPSVVDPDDLKRSTHLTGKGDKALRAGNLGKAVEHYRRALSIVPELPEAHIGLGHVWMQQRKFHSAYLAFQEARAGYENLSGDLFLLRDQRHRDARQEANYLRQQAADLENEALNFEAQAAYAPNPQQLNNIARRLRARQDQLLTQASNLESVEAPTVDTLDHVPGELHFFLGNALLNLDRIDAAVAEWERCARKSPKFPLVYNNLAVGYWRLNDVSRARDALTTAERLGFEVNPHFKQELSGMAAGGPSPADVSRSGAATE